MTNIIREKTSINIATSHKKEKDLSEAISKVNQILDKLDTINNTDFSQAYSALYNISLYDMKTAKILYQQAMEKVKKGITSEKRVNILFNYYLRRSKILQH